MNVTDRIRLLMQERGWTEYRLRKETNLPASTIANIFNRGTIPSLTTLESICNAFGISLCQFFAENNFVALNDEQQILLQTWSKLKKEQRAVLLSLMNQML